MEIYVVTEIIRVNGNIIRVRNNNICFSFDEVKLHCIEQVKEYIKKGYKRKSKKENENFIIIKYQNDDNIQIILQVEHRFIIGGRNF